MSLLTGYLITSICNELKKLYSVGKVCVTAMSTTTEIIRSATILWTLIKYASPVNKLSDWSMAILCNWLWRSREDARYIERQERAIENLQYQLVTIIRALKRMENSNRMEDLSWDDPIDDDFVFV